MVWTTLATICLASQAAGGDFDSKSLREFAGRSNVSVTELDCGPRCLAIVLSLLGRNTHWKELRSRFDVTPKGVTFSDVKRVASEWNCDLDAVRAPGERIRRLSFPAIGQLVPSTQLADRHFVVVLSVENDTVRLVDPSRERVHRVGDGKSSCASGRHATMVDRRHCFCRRRRSLSPPTSVANKCSVGCGDQFTRLIFLLRLWRGDSDATKVLVVNG